MLLADIVLFLSLTIGTILYFCVHLSPLLNLIFNTPILLLWTIGMGLLIWNMFGTWGHTCSINNWGNEDGMSICQQFKGMFSFVIIGWLCQIAMLVLDVRARRNQNALGRYDKMEDNRDLKLNPLDHSRDSSVHSLPLGAGLDGASQRLGQQRPQPHTNAPQSALTRASSFQSSAPTYTSQPQRNETYTDSPYYAQQSYTTQSQQSYAPQPKQYQAYSANPRFDPSYSTEPSHHTMNDFGYSSAPQQTRYDNYYGR